MMTRDGKSLIAVATSLPPKMPRDGCEAGDYQALCIQSWIDNGFHVLSVNHPDEIASLAARYPAVTFIPAARSASQWTGRNNPYIADLLLALKDLDQPVLGIINSDLLFQPSAAWMEKLPALVGEAMVVAHLYDSRSLLDSALHQYPGIDCFFFDRATALACFQWILELAPRHQTAHTASARLLWEMGRKRQAIAFLAKAAARNPDLAAVAALYERYCAESKTPIRNEMGRILGRITTLFTIRKNPAAPFIPSPPPPQDV